MILKIIRTAFFLVACALISHVANGASYTTADLKGSWFLHKVTSGDNPTDQPRWDYGTLVFNNAGGYTVTQWSSSGSLPAQPNGSMQISPCGAISVPSEPLIHGVMNEAKNQVAFIDGKSQGNGLAVMTRRASSVPFSTTNLNGVWRGHQVVTGDVSAGDDPRWGFGVVSISNNGSYTSIWNSPSASNEVTQGTLQIDAVGRLRIDNRALSHGAMSDDRQQMVFIDGSAQSGGNGLIVLERYNSNVSFQKGDLEGRWCGHQVVSGDRPADDPRWGYGTVVANAVGNYEANWNSPTQSNEVTNGLLTITGTGVVGIDNTPLIRGIMSGNKKEMVLIDGSVGSQGNSLTLLTRCNACFGTSGSMMLLLE